MKDELYTELLHLACVYPSVVAESGLPASAFGVVEDDYALVWNILDGYYKSGSTSPITFSVLKSFGVAESTVTEIFATDISSLSYPPTHHIALIGANYGLWTIEKDISLLKKKLHTCSSVEDVETAFSAFQTSTSNAIQSTNITSYSGETLDELTAAYLKEQDDLANGLSNYIPLPFKKVMTMIPGVMRGNLMSVLADPGVGKTSLMEQLSEYWASCGYNVIYFNYELPPSTMRQRMIQRHSGVDQIAQNDPKSLTTDQKTAIDNAIKKIVGWSGNIQHVYSVGWTIEKTISTAEKLSKAPTWKNKKPVDIIVLDYLTQIQSAGMSDTLSLNHIIKAVKIAGGKNGWVVVMGVQPDKENTGNATKNLDAALGTSAISQMSNIGIILHRNRLRTTNELGAKAVIEINKANAGRTGRVDAVYSGARLAFAETT